MKLSESFLSVQGEGNSVGTPGLFARLCGCNLACGLDPSGTASWKCDSERLWKSGEEVTNEELLAKVRTDGEKEGVDVLGGILDGTIHVVWTGGEPTLPKNRRDIASFLDYLSGQFPKNAAYHELETNGTIACGDGFYDRFDQINASPKLACSGMAPERRIVPEAISEIKAHRNCWFKFVVSSEEDVHEMRSSFLDRFGIDRRKVILMPAVDNRADLAEATRILFEICKRHGYRGVTRTHILAWDRKTGV